MNAQPRVVRDLFCLDGLRLILGTSMGGMNTWMWGYLYPGFAKALMPVACLPQKLTGRNLLFRRTILAIIEAGMREETKRSLLPQTWVSLGMSFN